MRQCSSALAAGLASLGLDLSSGGPAGEVTRCAESVADLEYAVQHLNPDLMRLLGYKFPVAEVL